MTGKEKYQLWRKLSFWPRLAVECGLCIGIAFLVEILFSRELVDLASAVVVGALTGFFFAVIDHAVFFGGRSRHWS